MRRELRFTPVADEQLTIIEGAPSLKGVLKQVRKTLGYLSSFDGISSPFISEYFK